MSLFQVTKKQVTENYELRTMTGDIVSFTPSYSQLLPDPFSDLNVLVNVLATGGNGTPDNPNPIVGYSSANITRCGVNLFDGSKVSITHPSNWDVSFENDNLTIVHKTAYVSGAPSFNLDLPLGTYVISYTATQLYKVSLYINGVYNKLLNNGTTFTIENGNIYTVTFTAENNSTNVISNIQIEKGSQASEYQPYNGQTYTIAFGQTVYGGVLDVTRGKLTVTHKSIDLGALSWTYRNDTNPNAPYFYASTPSTPDNVKYKGAYYSTNYGLLCSIYSSVARGDFPNTDFTMCVDGSGDTPSQFQIKNSNYTDAPSFTTAMDGVLLVYELATPFDIDLTPEVISAIVGTNNVFADCGETTVTCLI